MSLDTSGLPRPIDLDSTLGAAFVGVILSTFIFGTNTLQLYNYYTRYKNDGLYYKVAVGFIWFCDAAHSALTCHACYYYLVTKYGMLVESMKVIWSLKAQLFMTSIIATTVLSIYARRIWIFTRGNWVAWFVAVFIGIGSIVSVGASWWAIILLKTFFDAHDPYSWGFIYPMAVATTKDWLCAFTLCMYLRPDESRLHNAHVMVKRLYIYTLASGLATSICSLTGLLTFILLPDSLIYLATEFLMTKIYVSSLLALLNSRQRLRDQMAKVNLDALNLQLDSSDTLNDRLLSGKMNPFSAQTLHAAFPKSGPV